MKQGAKDKLRRLVAPLLGITTGGVGGGPSAMAFKAFAAIRPRISLRFEDVGVTLRNGSVILQGVTGRFSHSKACCARLHAAPRSGPCAGMTALMAVHAAD